MGSVPSDFKLPFTKPLTLGMRGTDVDQLQDWLNEMNDYYNFCQSPKEIKIFGFFGDETLKMVMAFQGFWDYFQTGIYDLQTHDLMEWKKYNYRINEGIVFERAKAKREQEEQAKKNKASFLRIGKLFKDGRFGK